MIEFNKIALILFILWTNKCNCQDEYSTKNYFKFQFLPDATMGIFIAFALPIDLPGRETYYSHFFEAIHGLPSNETSFEYPPLIERDLDRQMFYKALARKMTGIGYPGKKCVLRLICETAHFSVEYTNGILGEIFHILFTPSTTRNFGLSQDYEIAEIEGNNQNCSHYTKLCNFNILDLLTSTV